MLGGCAECDGASPLHAWQGEATVSADGGTVLPAEPLLMLLLLCLGRVIGAALGSVAIAAPAQPKRWGFFSPSPSALPPSHQQTLALCQLKSPPIRNPPRFPFPENLLLLQTKQLAIYQSLASSIIYTLVRSNLLTTITSAPLLLHSSIFLTLRCCKRRRSRSQHHQHHHETRSFYDRVAFRSIITCEAATHHGASKCERKGCRR